MQPHQNNGLRKIPSEKSKGIIGASLVHLGVLLLLFIVAFATPEPPEQEEGILVNFGTDDSGLGIIEPSPSTPSAATRPPAETEPETVESQTAEDPLITQDFDEEVPEVKKVDPEAEKKRLEQIEAERKRQAAIEAERIRKEQEEAERKRIEEEQRRTNEIMNRTANAINASNTGTKTTGEGVVGGQGNQGDPAGSVNSQKRGEGSGTGDKGILYDLTGRNFQSLPAPRYDYQGEGKVVVEISVDRSGKVTQANPGAKGSTTLDEYLLNAAKEAALKALFEPKPDAPVIQKGTITYNFVLK